MGYTRPPPADTYTDADRYAQFFQDWQKGYEDKRRNYSVCQFVEALGDGNVSMSIEQIIREHDTATAIDKNLPLA